MTELERISTQYDWALHGGAWHGKAVWETLEMVTPESAFAQPEGAAHCIWQLVKHMAYWETEVYRRMKGLAARPEDKFNFPIPTDATVENWNLALEDLRNSNTQLSQAIQEMDEAMLDKPLSSETFTHYVELHGVIQHHLYHAGQIALLQRLVASK